jgi:hypothetical protein
MNATLTRAVLMLAVAAPCAAQPPQTSHIRPVDRQARAVVAEGLARSAAFRQLAAHIESLDGLVYVRVATDPRGSSGPRLGGYLSQNISHALNLRVLRITLTERSGMRAAAVLAHELQHAIEVLEVPGVRTSADVEALFDRIGFRVAQSVMETTAARRVEDAVASQIASSTRPRP